MTSYPLPIIDLDLCLQAPSSVEASLEATKVVKALIEYGAVIVKDSRVSEAANDAFLDLLEDYFAQSRDVCKLDERPEYHYQGESHILLTFVTDFSSYCQSVQLWRTRRRCVSQCRKRAPN